MAIRTRPTKNKGHPSPCTSSIPCHFPPIDAFIRNTSFIEKKMEQETTKEVSPGFDVFPKLDNGIPSLVFAFVGPNHGLGSPRARRLILVKALLLLLLAPEDGRGVGGVRHGRKWRIGRRTRRERFCGEDKFFLRFFRFRSAHHTSPPHAVPASLRRGLPPAKLFSLFLPSRDTRVGRVSSERKQRGRKNATG